MDHISSQIKAAFPVKSLVLCTQELQGSSMTVIKTELEWFISSCNFLIFWQITKVILLTYILHQKHGEMHLTTAPYSKYSTESLNINPSPRSE